MKASGLYGSSQTQYLQRSAQLTSPSLLHGTADLQNGDQVQGEAEVELEAYTGTLSGLNSMLAGCMA